MKWFQNTYTRRFNARHGAWGHLFGGRYKAIPVEENANGRSKKGGDYLSALLDYIHLNPAQAGLISHKKQMKLVDYPWSSLSQGYAVPAHLRRYGMAVTEGLELFGYKDEKQGRQGFVRRLEKRALAYCESERLSVSAQEEEQTTIDRGWYRGGEAFREKLLLLAKGKKMNRTYRSGPFGREQERCSAEEWIEKGKKHFGIDLPDTGNQYRTERVAIAWAIHRKTNQPQAWIAEALGLRSAANVSQQVRRFQREIIENPESGNKGPLLLKWARLCLRIEKDGGKNDF